MNGYAYVYKMVSANARAKAELKRIIKAIEHCKEEDDLETIAEYTPIDLQEVLEILEEPEKENKK